MSASRVLENSSREIGWNPWMKVPYGEGGSGGESWKLDRLTTLFWELACAPAPTGLDSVLCYRTLSSGSRLSSSLENRIRKLRVIFDFPCFLIPHNTSMGTSRLVPFPNIFPAHRLPSFSNMLDFLSASGWLFCVPGLVHVVIGLPGPLSAYPLLPAAIPPYTSPLSLWLGG